MGFFEVVGIVVVGFIVLKVLRIFWRDERPSVIEPQNQVTMKPFDIINKQGLYSNVREISDRAGGYITVGTFFAFSANGYVYRWIMNMEEGLPDSGYMAEKRVTVTMLQNGIINDACLTMKGYGKITPVDVFNFKVSIYDNVSSHVYTDYNVMVNTANDIYITQIIPEGKYNINRIKNERFELL